MCNTQAFALLWGDGRCSRCGSNESTDTEGCLKSGSNQYALHQFSRNTKRTPLAGLDRFRLVTNIKPLLGDLTLIVMRLTIQGRKQRSFDGETHIHPWTSFGRYSLMKWMTKPMLLIEMQSLPHTGILKKRKNCVSVWVGCRCRRESSKNKTLYWGEQGKTQSGPSGGKSQGWGKIKLKNKLLCEEGSRPGLQMARLGARRHTSTGWSGGDGDFPAPGPLQELL